MGKVITGAGLQEFIQTGKHETIPDKPEIAPKPVVAEPPSEKAPATDKAPEAKEEQKDNKDPNSEDEDGLTRFDYELFKTEESRRKISRKHRAMKEAQEAQADAESFAKNQYDRARLAEERAAALERELQESKKAPEAKAPELVKPDIKDFTDDKGQIRWTEYTDKTAEYAAAKAVESERARQAQEQEARTKAQIEAQFKERLEKAKSKYPDFLEVLGASNAQVPNAVLQYITESEYGPDVSYYLAKHPEAAEKIAKLPPIRAIAEVGKLELTFEKPAEPKEEAASPVIERGGAPPPITPVSGTGSGTVNVDPAKMSFRELRDYERAKRKR